MTITHASLFSGIGAPELAASWMGWHNLFNCEINPFCRQILNYWFPNTHSYEDITQTDFKPWRGQVTVLSGGFPCQPFSHAGQRRGASDDRYLWPEMLRAIREIQPAYVLGENVIGLLSMVQPGSTSKVGGIQDLFGEGDGLYETRQQFVIETVCQDLESAGYAVQPMVIPACAVGAPHRRDRVWFLARHNDAENTLRLRREGQPAAQTAQDLQHRDAGTGDSQRHGTASGFAPDPAYAGSQNVSERGFQAPQTLFAAYTDGPRLEVANESGAGKAQEWMQVRRDFAGQYSPAIAEGGPQDRWQDFPTQSPVCRGNDGIPYRLDALSVPYPPPNGAEATPTTSPDGGQKP